MTYTLSRFGNSMVLIDSKGTRKNFKSIESLCDHINRYKMASDINGLQILPDFYLHIIGFTPQTEHSLLSSGLTNPKLIS